MLKNFILEYWIDEDWYVGRLREVPGVFSQGKSIKELEDNIKDAYHLVIEDDELNGRKIETKEIGIEV